MERMMMMMVTIGVVLVGLLFVIETNAVESLADIFKRNNCQYKAMDTISYINRSFAAQDYCKCFFNYGPESSWLLAGIWKPGNIKDCEDPVLENHLEIIPESRENMVTFGMFCKLNLHIDHGECSKILFHFNNLCFNAERFVNTIEPYLRHHNLMNGFAKNYTSYNIFYVDFEKFTIDIDFAVHKCFKHFDNSYPNIHNYEQSHEYLTTEFFRWLNNKKSSDVGFKQTCNCEKVFFIRHIKKYVLTKEYTYDQLFDGFCTMSNLNNIIFTLWSENSEHFEEGVKFDDVEQLKTFFNSGFPLVSLGGWLRIPELAYKGWTYLNFKQFFIFENELFENRVVLIGKAMNSEFDLDQFKRFLSITDTDALRHDTCRYNLLLKIFDPRRYLDTSRPQKYPDNDHLYENNIPLLLHDLEIEVKLSNVHEDESKTDAVPCLDFITSFGDLMNTIYKTKWSVKHIEEIFEKANEKKIPMIVTNTCISFCHKIDENIKAHDETLFKTNTILLEEVHKRLLGNFHTTRNFCEGKGENLSGDDIMSIKRIIYYYFNDDLKDTDIKKSTINSTNIQTLFETINRVALKTNSPTTPPEEPARRTEEPATGK